MVNPITRRKILLIEDEEETAKALVQVLCAGGFMVLHATDGKQGIATAEKEKPDFILLDIVMPGMSGMDVLATLKNSETTRSIPVLILSQLSDQDNISRAISLGATGYLVKSEYQLDDILGKLKEILKR